MAITDATFNTVLSGDTAVSSAGGFVRVTGSGFRTGANVFLNNVLCSNSLVSSTQINANIPASANGSYVFSVFNTDGSGGTWLPGLAVSGPPAWTTSSYSANTLTLSIQLLATGDAPLTYYIQPGSSNPQNLAVSSSGLLTGTVSGDGAYSLTVIVDDAQNQSVQETITVTVQVTDPYFNLTTLALPGDGTNNANNHSFIDSSSNAYAITRNGSTTQGTFSPFSQTGWSSFFNGSSTISLPSDAAFNLSSGTWTFEGFFYLTAAPAKTCRAMMIGSNNNLNSYVLFAINTDLTFGCGVPFTGTGAGSGAVALPLNQWNHVAIVMNASTGSVYLNGVRVGNQAGCTQMNNVNAALTIGQDSSEVTVNAIYAGYMASVRIIKGVALYSGLTCTVPTSPLTAVSGTSFLTFTQNRFVDLGSSLTMTLNGTPSVQTFSPFAPTAAYSVAAVGGSGYFDGDDNLVLPLAINSSIGALAGKQLTFEFWINTSEIAAVTAFNMGLFGNFVAVAVNARYGIFLTGSSTTSPQNVQFGWTTSPSAATNVTTTATLNQKSWNHVAITVNATTSSSTTIVIYLNGVGQTFTGQNLSSHTADPNYNFHVAETREGTQNFRGFMGGFKISTGIQRTGNFTPPTTPFTSDANTILLLDYQNAGITDATAKTVLETVGDAKISTAVSKFGGSSMFFDGTGDYLIAPYSQISDFGTGDFTVEFWMNASAAGTYVAVVGTQSIPGNSTAGMWRVSNRFNSANGLYFNYTTGSSFIDVTFSTTNYNDGTWRHIAVSRASGSLRAFVDGAQVGSTTSVTQNLTSGQRVNVGWNSQDGQFYTGYIDDLRITRGFARYTANFTPPTAAFNLR